MNKQPLQLQATVLIVGAGFIGVEWATELEHFFPKPGPFRSVLFDFRRVGEMVPEMDRKFRENMLVMRPLLCVWACLAQRLRNLKITIIDFLPRCLGPLPDGAADYCSDYMAACGIKEFYNCSWASLDHVFVPIFPSSMIAAAHGSKTSPDLRPRSPRQV